jgi:hypothetical protein
MALDNLPIEIVKKIAAFFLKIIGLLVASTFKLIGDIFTTIGNRIENYVK